MHFSRLEMLMIPSGHARDIHRRCLQNVDILWERRQERSGDGSPELELVILADLFVGSMPEDWMFVEGDNWLRIGVMRISTTHW